jgi:malonyl CoA-acyl carrier protein transacylase
VRALLALTPNLVECGPGKVLTGLNRRIERSAHCYALEDPESLSAAVAATAAIAATATSSAQGSVHA